MTHIADRWFTSELLGGLKVARGACSIRKAQRVRIGGRAWVYSKRRVCDIGLRVVLVPKPKGV